MRDVARAAGVSQTTVSLVLNEVPDAHIGQKTRERVLATIDGLGYRPNAVARGLRRSRTDTVGLLWSDGSGIAGQVVQGAQEAALARGSLLLLAGTGGDAHVADEICSMLVDRRVDALLVATSNHRAVVTTAQMSSLPTVLVGCTAVDGAVAAVVADHAAAAFEGTEAMLHAGSRRVAFLGGAVTPTTRLRLAGYWRALLTRGLEKDPALVRDRADELTRAYEAALQLMGGRHRVDGLLCCNREAAAGVYQAAADAGLGIPDDFSVVAFDEPDSSAPLLRPALSTVTLPRYEMARIAVDAALDAIGGRAPAGGERRVPYAFRGRDSIATR